MEELKTILLKYQKIKCLIKKKKINKYKLYHHKLEDSEKKIKNATISIPFWIMENLAESVFCVPIIFKDCRIVYKHNHDRVSNFCLFSAFNLIKNLFYSKYIIILKDSFVDKFTITMENGLIQGLKDIEKTKIKKCIFEKLIFNGMNYPKVYTLIWKKK